MQDTDTETQVIDPLAASIMDAHQVANDIAQDARGAVERTIAARVHAAALVDAATARHGSGLKEWWLSNLPALDWAIQRQYMTIHRTRDRPAPDKRQLQLVGILDASTRTEQHTAHAENPLAWFSLVARLNTAMLDADAASIPNGARMAMRRPLAQLRDTIDKFAAEIAGDV